jgi:murein DD-endopeptidase MepM/ murein hydrolase activator NlpD
MRRLSLSFTPHKITSPMQIQFHPASGRGTVRRFSVEAGGQRFLIAAAAALVLLALSLWLSVPAVLNRRLREGEARRFDRELERTRADWNRTAELARALRHKALDSGDFLNRIAFLYAVPVVEWPLVLNPEHAILGIEEPGRVAAALALYLRGLERGHAIVVSRERIDPNLPLQVPSIVPIVDAQFEPSAYFGPRRSPWTGEEEFFLGVDLATPEGSAVVAPGAGTVVFAGTVRRAMTGWFWRLGNVVVVAHGKSGVTVFGHLARIDVRRGQRVSRGDRLGSVGATGWAISPQLHYELWRPEGDTLRPTDPLFAALDRRLGRVALSLEQMEATSAPGPLDPLPGIQIAAAEAAGPQRSPGRGPGRSRSRRRI